MALLIMALPTTFMAGPVLMLMESRGMTLGPFSLLSLPLQVQAIARHSWLLANAQIVKLTNQIAQLNDENQNLQLLLASLQADMAALQLQLSDLQSQVSALQMSLNAANAKNQKLISAINNALAVLESPGKNKQQAISKAITTLKAGLQ